MVKTIPFGQVQAIKKQRVKPIITLMNHNYSLQSLNSTIQLNSPIQ